MSNIFRPTFLALMASAILPLSTQALIIHGDTTSTSNPSAHYQRPTTDYGWDYVGSNGVGTGVYLGNRWVITAAHVSTGPTFTLSGTDYNILSGSTRQITNGDGSNADLMLFRIENDPGLAFLRISETSPSGPSGIGPFATPGTAGQMIGTGRDRGSALAMFPRGEGYAWAAARAKVWGNNSVQTNPADPLSLGGRTTQYFTTRFDKVVGEGQAADNDSGSAFFRSDTGELAGIAIAISTVNGASDGTAVFGDNTLYADLSAYRDQIVSVIPEPASVSLVMVGLTFLLGASRPRRARSAR